MRNENHMNQPTELVIKDEALVLRPGDIIVMKTDRQVTAEEAAYVQACTSMLGIRALVIGPGWSIERQSIELPAEPSPK